MTMYACGKRKVIRSTIVKNKLVSKWKRDHGHITLTGNEADDWLIIACANDLVVAPPEIAALMYCRCAYLNKLCNNSIFEPTKNQAFSMGVDSKELETQLQATFHNIRRLPIVIDYGFALAEEQTHREHYEVETLELSDHEGTIAPRDKLQFSSQMDGIDSIELLGITIDKTNENHLTQR